MEDKKAPNFELADQDGKIQKLEDYSGKWVVLYVYPRDNTPGCTKEACNFRDERDVIAKEGNATVIGLSKDSVASHKKFADKHHLNFTLLSDPEHTLIEALGAWKPKKFMGREMMGVHRNTYIIDPSGKIAKEYLGVNPVTHASEIIDDLKTLQTR
jgi:peroxiredoxin Q/BCP